MGEGGADRRDLNSFIRPLEVAVVQLLNVRNPN